VRDAICDFRGRKQSEPLLSQNAYGSRAKNIFMKNEFIYRIVIVGLLGSILAVQITILNRTPKVITMSALNATGEQRSTVIQNVPLVGVLGSIDVNVQNSVEVHTKPFVPLEVSQ
jgi:hypothetical protein